MKDKKKSSKESNVYEAVKVKEGVLIRQKKEKTKDED